MKKKTKKKLKKVVLIIFLIFLFCIIIYLFFFWKNQNRKNSICPSDAKLCPDNSYVFRTGPDCQFEECPAIEKREEEINNNIDWNLLILDIEKDLKKEFKDAGKNYPITIEKTEDITGDKIPEALVDLGNSGASTTNFTILRIENNKPVISKFKSKDGKILTMEFMSGGAGKYYSKSIELDPLNKAVISGGYMIYGSSDDNCDYDAYVWNENSKFFEYNLELSKKITEKRCKELCEDSSIDKSLLQNICK